MRVLMVNAYGYVTGGVDRHCLALAGALQRRGHEVAFLSTASGSNVIDKGRFVRQTVGHFNRESLTLRQRARATGWALWNPDAARAMKELLADFSPDVVHAHKLYVQLSVAPLIIAGRRNVPIVQTAHDYEFLSASALDHSGGRVDRDESRFSYRALNTATHPIRQSLHAPRVNAWICASRFVAHLHAERGIRAHILPYFVERASSHPPDGHAERRGAVFVGRLVSAKGVADVLDVARRLPNVPVTIAGDGALAGDVRSHAHRLDNLEFVGFAGKERVMELLRTARVALMPSRWKEPAGIAALEAMSVGTPVLAYANGGLAEYVGDARAGRLVPEHPGALAQACAELHDDAGQWQRLSEAGPRAIEEAHDIGQYVERLEGIYQSARALARLDRRPGW